MLTLLVGNFLTKGLQTARLAISIPATIFVETSSRESHHVLCDSGDDVSTKIVAGIETANCQVGLQMIRTFCLAQNIG
jgi:hypothetical protein